MIQAGPASLLKRNYLKSNSFSIEKQTPPDEPDRSRGIAPLTSIQSPVRQK